MINYLTTQIRLLVAILAFVLPLSFAKAEVKGNVRTDSQGWYIGIEGGMPLGFSTFSSFGHDKTHLGWAAGLYGGYRFNSIFSAELSAKYGEMNLSAQDCCVERNYWLGSDGMLYNAGVLGMDSWERAESVKIWLAKNGIEASRITAIGNSDDTQDAAKARRVETIDNNNQ